MPSTVGLVASHINPVVPIVDSIYPPTAVTSNEKLMTITGSNFLPDALIHINGVAQPATVYEPTLPTKLFLHYQPTGPEELVFDVRQRGWRSVESERVPVNTLDPTTVPGLVQWLDPDHPPSIVYSDATLGEISQWDARFGGIVLPQSIVAQQPSLSRDAHMGSELIYANYLETLGGWGAPSAYAWDPVTQVRDVFVVSRRASTGTGGGGNCYAYYDDLGNLAFHHFQPGAGYRSAGYQEVVSPNFAVDNNWHLWEWTVMAGALDIALWRSGVDSEFRQYVGAYTPAQSHYMWLAEQSAAAYSTEAQHCDRLVFVTPTGMPAADRGAVLDWLLYKWGTVGNDPMKPAVTCISPLLVAEATPTLLNVHGANFMADAVVRIDGVDQPTTFVSANVLLATVTLPGPIGTVGQVTVWCDGKLTNAKTLEVSWTPALLPGLSIWLDGADTTTFTFSSPGQVSAWQSKAPNGWEFTSPTVDFQPKLKTLSWGCASVPQFYYDDLTADLGVDAFFPSTWYLWIVLRIEGGYSNPTYLCGRTSATGAGGVEAAPNANWLTGEAVAFVEDPYSAVYSDMPGGDNVLGKTTDPGMQEYAVIGSHADGVTSWAHVNGVDALLGRTYSTPSLRFVRLAGWCTEVNRADGQPGGRDGYATHLGPVVEVVMVDTNADAATQTQVLAYLDKKYSLSAQLNLPVQIYYSDVAAVAAAAPTRLFKFYGSSFTATSVVWVRDDAAGLPAAPLNTTFFNASRVDAPYNPTTIGYCYFYIVDGAQVSNELPMQVW